MSEPQFFYTVDTPYRWGGGRTIITSNDEFAPIESLEEAKLLAIKNNTGEPYSEDYVQTTYGIEFKLERD